MVTEELNEEVMPEAENVTSKEVCQEKPLQKRRTRKASSKKGGRKRKTTKKEQTGE